IDPTEEKRDPLDFALWKGQKPGEPAWESPWGMGRPGWHIECSAMSMSILGESFDIHGGGQDLIFPHHENEIAQSEAATGKPFARYWMHNGYINVDNQKMSKSLNNFFTIRDIAAKYDLEAVRLFMLSAHYRSPVNYSQDMIEQATTALERLKTAKERLEEAQLSPEPTPEDAAFLQSLEQYRTAFEESMDDDLNTAGALGVLFDLARACNIFVTEPRGKAAVEKAREVFAALTGVLGILSGKKEESIPQEALDLLEKRQAARAEKNWAEADALRDTLKAMGYVIEDTKTGPKLKAEK
ncbi:MAG: cysteine--tRNA ligase, partial [Eubacteriales bacterium]|nr:cysteine--tRNA ligase [Eubacteriales bacterium]